MMKSRRVSLGASSEDEERVVWKGRSRIPNTIIQTPSSRRSAEDETPCLFFKKRSSIQRPQKRSLSSSSKKARPSAKKTKQLKLSFFTPSHKVPLGTTKANSASKSNSKTSTPKPSIKRSSSSRKLTRKSAPTSSFLRSPVPTWPKRSDSKCSESPGSMTATPNAKKSERLTNPNGSQDSPASISALLERIASVAVPKSVTPLSRTHSSPAAIASPLRNTKKTSEKKPNNSVSFVGFSPSGTSTSASKETNDGTCCSRFKYWERRDRDGRLRYRRFLVEGVENIKGGGKRILAMEEGTEEIHTIDLAGQWVSTPVIAGDSFNLIPAWQADMAPHNPQAPPSLSPTPDLSCHTGERRWRVTDEAGLIILHPDVLISGTRVGGSTPCVRKAVLGEIYKSSAPSLPALNGILGHQVFEQCLFHGDFSEGFIKKQIKTAIPGYVEDIYTIGKSEKECEEFLSTLVNNITTFGNKYGPTTVKKDSKQHRRNISRKSSSGTHGTHGTQPDIQIDKVLDIEESIWCPAFGLKGVVDASVSVRRRSRSGKFPKKFSKNTEKNEEISRPDSGSKWVVPFELKTGKRYSVAHRAQVLLYTLLMSDRYNTHVTSGLLFNAQTSDLRHINAIHSEIMSLVIRRNEIASILSSNPATSTLPPLLKQSRECSRCFQREECMIHHRVFESGTAEGCGETQDVFLASGAGALSAAHVEYMRKWLKLIDLETGTNGYRNNEIWTTTPSERQKRGQSLSHLRLLERKSPKIAQNNLKKSHEPTQNSTPAAIFSDAKNNERMKVKSAKLDEKAMESGPVVYVFECTEPCKPVAPTLTQSTILSTQSRKEEKKGGRKKAPGGGIGVGDLVAVSSQDGMLAKCFAVVTSIEAKTVEIRVEKGDPLSRFLNLNPNPTFPRLWSLDRYAFGNSASAMRNNILELFCATERAGRLRRRVVDVVPPRFSIASITIPPSLRKDFNLLNDQQRRAVTRCLQCKDYLVLLGMPGTGKSTVVVFLVRALVELKQRVLITAYTHTAVDNLLVKLKSHKVNFLRFGRPSSVDIRVRDSCIDIHKREHGRAHTVRGFRELVESTQVVASTCLGVGKGFFQSSLGKSFDTCIVDEAGQIIQPVCIGPLLLASRFVLVGDHYQLPPLCKSTQARIEGFDVSLISRLASAHPEVGVARLSRQYRMAFDIMLLPNTLIYNHQLTCATQAVADSKLILDCKEPVDQWLRRVLEPETRVGFIDTDLVNSAAEKREFGGYLNKVEVRVVKEIVNALFRGGIKGEQIGVVSPYRRQLVALRKVLGEGKGVMAETVDKFQGLDKDCIVISLVRSNHNREVGKLLRDWRRINVAITRAKKKLVFVGSLATLSHAHLLAAFIELLEEKNWIISLPQNFKA
ncbi:hypothetical protein AAMO2058_000577200 [Amorphochlora amoebiformis]